MSNLTVRHCRNQGVHGAHEHRVTWLGTCRCPGRAACGWCGKVKWVDSMAPWKSGWACVGGCR